MMRIGPCLIRLYRNEVATSKLSQIPIRSEQIFIAKRRVFQRINEDRRRHGVPQVQWDELASKVGDLHCREMLEHRYMSHWNLEGYKPYHRYSFVGGNDCVNENCGRFSMLFGSLYTNATPYDVIKNAIRLHKDMMAERPPMDGHRRTILDPTHTHVGVGLAWNHEGLRLAQEFLKRYVTLSLPVARNISISNPLLIKGRILDPGNLLRSIAIYYESFPRPMNTRQLNNTSTYTMPDVVDEEYLLCKHGHFYSDGSTGSITIDKNGGFECPIRFKRGPGLYTICIFIKDRKQRDIPSTSLTVRVRT